MTHHITNTDNPIDFPAHAKGWRKRQIENLRAAAELHAGDGGYEEGTQEEYEAFVAKRNQSRFDALMYDAGLTAQGCWDQMDQYDREAIMRFAELIVLEGARWLGNREFAHPDAFKQHFGVKE